MRILLLALLTAATAAAQAGETFRVDAGATRVTLRVGKSGLLAFAGHEHEVVAPAVEGTVTLDRGDLSRSGVWLRFDAAALKVTGKGEPAKDVPEVQRVMMSAQVLDVGRFPTIEFRSKSVSVLRNAADQVEVRLAGELTLHGVTRPLIVPATVRLSPHQVTADGKATIRQTDFGIRPVTAGAGTVRVKDEVEVVFAIRARRALAAALSRNPIMPVLPRGWLTIIW